ncbi:MAG: membrane protein insertion efficiency factor YidD [Elusimicrobiota bacterium]
MQNYINNKLLPQIAIFLIKAYQKAAFFIPRRCRFYPTCSSYSIEAFNQKGFIKGLYLTIIRILKCNPFHQGGYDPVK